MFWYCKNYYMHFKKHSYVDITDRLSKFIYMYRYVDIDKEQFKVFFQFYAITI